MAKDSHIELIRVIGGGPAGLIFALLNEHEKHKIVIHEKLDLDPKAGKGCIVSGHSGSVQVGKKLELKVVFS